MVQFTEIWEVYPPNKRLHTKKKEEKIGTERQGVSEMTKKVTGLERN